MTDDLHLEQTRTEPDKEERTWAMFAHLGGPIGMLVSAGTLGFLVPLFVYLARRDNGGFAADQGKEALNFQFTLFLLHIGGFLAMIFTLGLGAVIVVPIFILLWMVEVICGVIGGLQAYDGKRYRYPIAMRLL